MTPIPAPNKKEITHPVVGGCFVLDGLSSMTRTSSSAGLPLAVARTLKIAFISRLGQSRQKSINKSTRHTINIHANTSAWTVIKLKEVLLEGHAAGRRTINRRTNFFSRTISLSAKTENKLNLHFAPHGKINKIRPTYVCPSECRANNKKHMSIICSRFETDRPTAGPTSKFARFLAFY